MVHSPQEFPITNLREFHDAPLEILPAAVPGNFELDLLAANKIPDPFVGMNMKDLYNLETHHVWYAKVFDVDIVENYSPFLTFDGSDCFARYYLNGHLLGTSDNALVEHEFAAAQFLQNGRNELVVHFRPALIEAKKYFYPAHLEAFQVNYESLHVRKAPHSYGWDIMPRALSAGLWRDVALQWKPIEGLEEIYLETLESTFSAALLRLFFRGHFQDYAANYEIEINGQGTQSSFFRKERVFFEAGQIIISVDDPQLWWPRGRGEAHLYDVTVRLLKNGQEIDCVLLKHGIRSVRLERTSIINENGEGEFCFYINDQKTFILGNNHVPLDAYHSRDLSHTQKYFSMLDELGCNMLRCWGGNVYESNLFYDLCDEKGILVWQDFSMACASYPRSAEFQHKITEEVTKVVRRLRQHPCIALWAGDNECDCSGFRKRRQNDDPNLNLLTREVLPRVLSQHDPGREYLPSSPYIDQVASTKTLSDLAEQHPWGPRDYFKSDYYQNIRCHFASEMGYHGCPHPDSVKKFITPENWWPPENKEWMLHASSPYPGYDLYDYRVALMKKQIHYFFGYSPETLEEFALMSQIVQAEAKKYFIEFFRTGKWRRTGIIWWNLRDGWPQFSDAVVDYYFKKKLAYSFIKRAQQPLLLTFREPQNDQIQLVACNDTQQDITLHYNIKDISANTAVIDNMKDCAKNDATTVLATLNCDVNQQKIYCIEWESNLGASKNHYLCGSPFFDFGNYVSCYNQVYEDNPLIMM